MQSIVQPRESRIRRPRLEEIAHCAGFSFGASHRGAKKRSVSTFDPSTLSLAGWWRASYSASPWVGTASAGASGTRDLTEATNPPAVGTAVNGYDPADFDGSNDVLANASAFHTTFVSTGAGSIWVLFQADTAAADAGAGSRFNNEGLLAQDGGGTTFNLGFSTSGVTVDLFDGAWKERVVACSTGSIHLAQVKWDSSNLYLRVDSGAWSSTAAGALNGPAGGLVVGRNYSTAFFDGTILDVGTASSAFADSVFDDLIEYVNDRYGQTL